MDKNISSVIKNRFRAAKSAVGRDAQIPVFDSFLLEMADDEKISVKGCRGIITYSAEEISLLTDKFIVTVRGEGLFIKNFSDVAATVGGRADSVEFGRDMHDS